MAGSQRGFRSALAGALLLLAVLPMVAAAEPCQPGPAGWSAGLEAGGIRYEVAEGLSGVEWGPDVAVRGSRLEARVGYRRVELRDGSATPHLLRGTLTSGLGSGLGMRLCATAHAGASRFSADADQGTVLAGGAGVGSSREVMVAGTPLFPFIEVRGLAARSSGTILDLSIDGSGLSLGVEAGVMARVGRVRLQATGSLDGFAPGLGATPYPARALRIGVDYGF